MFNILVVTFMFSIIMLLFFLINIIAKLINNRSVRKSIVMINLFFIITNISFIFGGIFFAKQNNMAVFDDIKFANNYTSANAETTEQKKSDTNNTKEETKEEATYKPLPESTLTKSPPLPEETITTSDSQEDIFDNIDWDLVISDTLHDAKNKLSYEHLSIDLDNNTREFYITMTSPIGQTEETIIFNIYNILELINSNTSLQNKNIKHSTNDYYGGVFDDYSAVLNVNYFDSMDKILDNYVIFAGEHKIKPIPLNMPLSDIVEPTPTNTDIEEDATNSEITIEYGESN